MGCGCGRGGKRPTTRTVVPSSARNTPSKKIVSDQQKESTINQIRANASGMTKEQRETERKRRIQALLVRKPTN